MSADGMITTSDGDIILSCREISDGTAQIPETVTAIDDYAFYMCDGITGEIFIPANVTSIGTGAFAGCSGTCFVVDGNNSQYASVDGFLMTKDCKTLISCPTGRTGDITIPSCVETVGYLAFYNCTGLTGSLTINNNVKEIDDYAFANCTGLKYIEFGCGTDTVFGNDVFKNIVFKDASGKDLEQNAKDLSGKHFGGTDAVLTVNAGYPVQEYYDGNVFYLYVALVGILLSALVIGYHFRDVILK